MSGVSENFYDPVHPTELGTKKMGALTSKLLEKEIKNGDWLILKNPDNFIFNVPDEKKWIYIINKLGIDFHEDWTSKGGEA